MAIKKKKKRLHPHVARDEDMREAEEVESGVGPEVYRVVPESPRIRALIYGEPGCGKTTLAATAEDHPDMAPILFANIEGGLLSIAHRGDIHAVDIESTEELYELYRAIKRGDEPYDGIETVVIDNITELQTLNLDEIVQAELEESENDNRVSPDEIWQEDYGKSTVQLGRLFRWMKGLNRNIILTAHAKFVYPPQPKGKRQAPELTQAEPLAVLPMLTQKLMKGVMGLVDFVWYLQYDTESKQRLMLTRPDGIYQAKTRGPLFAKAMGSVVENPTMPELYDLLVESSSKKPKRKEK